MPCLGLGMSHNGGGDFAVAVRSALAAGVRAFDTATRYGTEHVLGEEITQALGEGHVARRSDVFITTKLWPGDAQNVSAALRSSLEKLQVEYVDLYLVHWPGLTTEHWDESAPAKARQAVWRDMERQLDAGRCRSIGVSNWLERHLQDILIDEAKEISGIVPDINQIEHSPIQRQSDLIRFCRDRGIRACGYSPFEKGAALRVPEIISAARKCGCTPAELIIQWSLSRDVICTAKSTSPDHIHETFVRSFTHDIPENALAALDNLDVNYRCTWDPTSVP